MKKMLVFVSLFLAALVVFYACRLEQQIQTSSQIISTTLKKNAERSLRRDGEIKSIISYDCNGYDDTDVSACLTPTNVSGKVYYAGIMVGLGNGYSLGPIIGSVQDPSKTTSYVLAGLMDFDMSKQLTANGGFTCCGGAPYPDDDEAIVRAVEIMFGYVDVMFTLPEDDISGPLAGEHTIRVVYGDIDDTEMKKGDLLYKSENGDFVWCTDGDGCTHETRPDSPLQYDEIVQFNGTPDGKGPQVIPSFSAELAPGHSEVKLTESDVKNNSWQFVIDFYMKNGVLLTEDPAKMDTLAQLLQAFRLAATPGNQAETGFKVGLVAIAAPLDGIPSSIPASTTSIPITTSIKSTSTVFVTTSVSSSTIEPSSTTTVATDNNTGDNATNTITTSIIPATTTAPDPDNDTSITTTVDNGTDTTTTINITTTVTTSSAVTTSVPTSTSVPTTSSIMPSTMCSSDEDCEQWALDLITNKNILVQNPKCVDFVNGSYCTTGCNMPDWAFPQCGQIMKAYGIAYEDIQCTTPDGGKDTAYCESGDYCYCSENPWFQ